jgi:hypothetical protein
MDAAPPSSNHRVPTLTAEKLQSLPRVSRFVQAFVAEQRGNTAYYAKEASYLRANLENLQSSSCSEKAIVNHDQGEAAQPASPPLIARVQLRKEGRKQLDPPIEPPNTPKPPIHTKVSRKIADNTQNELFYGHSRKKPSKVIASTKQKPASASDEEEYRERELDPLILT